MAGKDFALRATLAAVAVIERLRGAARRSYAAFETELRKQGCRVAGYRLLWALKMVVGWPSVGSAPGERAGRKVPFLVRL